MEEMRVYVANLGKYNEGELVGDWFEPPIDYEAYGRDLSYEGTFVETRDGVFEIAV